MSIFQPGGSALSSTAPPFFVTRLKMKAKAETSATRRRGMEIPRATASPKAEGSKGASGGLGGGGGLAAGGGEVMASGPVITSANFCGPPSTTDVPFTVTVTTPLAASAILTASTLLTVSAAGPMLPLSVSPLATTSRSRLLTRGFAEMGSAGGSVHTSTTLISVPNPSVSPRVATS
eukprot:scaffold77134_cov63-Phaeocystis_antarctica.AAC.6